MVAATFLAGSVLSYPLYLLLSGTVATAFPKVFHFTVLLLGISLGLYYLKASGNTSVLGFGSPWRLLWRRFALGFLWGGVILAIVAASLFAVGLRQADPDLQRGLLALLRALAAAVLSGLVVGLTEEALFRGAIFTGLTRYSGTVYALLVSSLFYAAVHFIDFTTLPSGAGVSFPGAITGLGKLFSRFGDPAIYDSFTSLFVLGMLFGLARWHSGNIWPGAGLHAGIVTCNKLFSYAADYRPGSAHENLVNIYDKTTGHLASFWLVLACLVYYFWCMRPRSRQGAG